MHACIYTAAFQILFKSIPYVSLDPEVQMPMSSLIKACNNMAGA
jgi:hypothetical protein